MATNLQCQFCGVQGFRDNWALRSHQVRNGLCLSKKRTMARAQETQMDQKLNDNEERMDDMTEVVHPSTNDEMHIEIPSEGLLHSFSEDDLVKGMANFDATFQLVFFMRQCHNGGGLSHKDMNMLLKLLHHPDFSLKDINVKSVAEVCKYEENLTEQQDNWEKVEMREETDNAPNVHLFCRNPLTVLEELYSSPKNREGFAIRSSVVTKENTRSYTNLQSGEWWEEMDRDVQSSCVGGVVAPIILYSDQTSLSHNRRTQGWPLVMTLGNISNSQRSLPSGHSLLAILPMVGNHDLGEQATLSRSRTKLELFHKCEELILAPLKQASRSGIHLKDPFGQSQWVFPRLCLYICDQTEGSKVTCTYDTNKSRFPCSSCCCPKKSLNNVTKRFPYRTENMMKQVLEEIERVPVGNKDELSKLHSVHPVQCALWDFAGSDLSTGNPYRCIQLDGLHQSILGIFKTLVGIVRKCAASFKLVAHPLQELDRRMQIIQKDCRYASFRLPGNYHNGYFQSNANFHGFEHKFVMQVVAFCLLGVVPNYIIQVFVDFIDWYLVAFQSKQHTEDSLEQMDNLMRKAVASMKRHMMAWQKSDFKTVKIHFMVHLKDCIKRCGLPSEYDTGIYEHLHIGLMKIPYRHSNKRQYVEQLMRHNQRTKVLSEEAQLQEDIWVHHDDATALDMAVTTGRVMLSGKDLSLQIPWLNCINDSLPVNVQELFASQPEILCWLKRALDTHMKDEDCTVPKLVQVWKGLAVPAGEGDRFANWPMYTRACRSFHGRPWYGFVDIQMEAALDNPVTWTGQLRLLFSCDSFDHVSGRRKTFHLAFVRLLQPLPRDEDFKTLRCEKFRWVDEEMCEGRMSIKRHRSKDRDHMFPYMVFDIANIARVVQVIPNFSQSGTYFLNRFKL